MNSTHVSLNLLSSSAKVKAHVVGVVCSYGVDMDSSIDHVRAEWAVEFTE